MFCGLMSGLVLVDSSAEISKTLDWHEFDIDQYDIVE